MRSPDVPNPWERCGLTMAHDPQAFRATTPDRFRGALSGDGRRALRDGLARLDGVLPPPGGAEPGAGALSLRGERPSGTGPADGGAVRPDGRVVRDAGLGFDAPVAETGYAWWYVDALSADGRYGITIIAFIGSVFSPYYAWARRRGRRDPTDHCAMNVALYGPRRNLWAMTERGRGGLLRERATLAIGPSTIAWDRTALTIRIDERCTPWPSRIRGTVRLYPAAVSHRVFDLDETGGHRWRPVAPCAIAEVMLEQPGTSWSGPAYFDMNTGDAPLESGFRTWTWSRAPSAQRTGVLYDVERRDGSRRALSLAFDSSGGVRDLAPLSAASLPATRWRMKRTTRADAGHTPTVIRTLEDAPFYARSVLATQIEDTPVTAVHESLSLDRFRAPLVQAMLPFRMPRRAS